MDISKHNVEVETIIKLGKVTGKLKEWVSDIGVYYYLTCTLELGNDFIHLYSESYDKARYKELKRKKIKVKKMYA